MSTLIYTSKFNQYKGSLCASKKVIDLRYLMTINYIISYSILFEGAGVEEGVGVEDLFYPNTLFYTGAGVRQLEVAGVSSF